jgi:hypothetical protein
VEKMRRHCSCCPEGFPALLWIFRGLFCNFKVFNVIFI